MKYYIKSFGIGSLSKIINALIQLTTVPLLLNHYGKANFGLIGIGLAVNAYMALLDLGINIGSIKNFSQWIEKKDFEMVQRVSKASITFYGIIGLVNALLLVTLSILSENIFKFTQEQFQILDKIFLILALFSVINWVSFVFRQIITAYEKVFILHLIEIIRNVITLILILLVPVLNIPLLIYFLLFSAIQAVMILPMISYCLKLGYLKDIVPTLELKVLKPILRYGLSILAIGIFSFTATKFRPILLGIFSDSEKSSFFVSDYRIMETITLFITSIGGLLLPIFLPKTSQLMLKNDRKSVNNFAITSTLYTSIISCVLCFPIMINSKEILEFYVGNEFVHLKDYLILWIITILFYLHNTPVSSIVLSTGKTKALVLSSGFACISSLIINVFLIKTYGSGASVIGYTFYIIIQMCFYYFYFNRKVLNLDSFGIFISFLKPVVLGFLLLYMMSFLIWPNWGLLTLISIKAIVWTFSFTVFLFMFSILKLENIKAIFAKKS